VPSNLPSSGLAYGVCRTNDRFIVCGAPGPIGNLMYFSYSLTGTAFTAGGSAQVCSASATIAQYSRIQWNGSIALATLVKGYSSPGTTYGVTTTDGVTATQRTALSSGYGFNSFVCLAGTFLLSPTASNNISSAQVIISTDGVTYSNKNTPSIMSSGSSGYILPISASSWIVSWGSSYARTNDTGATYTPVTLPINAAIAGSTTLFSGAAWVSSAPLMYWTTDLATYKAVQALAAVTAVVPSGRAYFTSGAAYWTNDMTSADYVGTTQPYVVSSAANSPVPYVRIK